MANIIINGKEYEVAPKTMKVARMIDAAEKAATVMDVYKKQWEMVNFVLGKESAAEAIGGSDLEKIDLNRLVSTYNAVILGDESEVVAERREQEEQFLNSPAVGLIKDIARDVRTITDATKNGI